MTHQDRPIDPTDETGHMEGSDPRDGEGEHHATTGGAAAAGAATGAVVGLAGGPVAAAVGAVGGAIVGALSERVMHADDDREVEEGRLDNERDRNVRIEDRSSEQVQATGQGTAGAFGTGETGTPGAWKPSLGEDGILSRVREGMPAFDASGRQIGKVEFVKFGDPEAVTPRGNEPTLGDIPVVPFAVAVADDEPDVPEPRRSHLLRVGYIRIHGPGLFGHDRYAAADEVTVEGDAVRILPLAPRTPPRPTTSQISPTFETRPLVTSPQVTPARPVQTARRDTTPLLQALAVGAGVGLVLGGVCIALLRWRQRQGQPVERLRHRARELGHWTTDRASRIQAINALRDAELLTAMSKLVQRARSNSRGRRSIKLPR